MAGLISSDSQLKRKGRIMQRLLPIVAAAAATLFIAPAAFAGGYSATPATGGAASFVARDVLFKCGADGCVAAKASNSRPAIVCAAVVKEVGAVSSFAADGAAFDAEALAKCNARAKGIATAGREGNAVAR